MSTKLLESVSTRKASFASAEITKELTGMEIGGVTPVGLPEISQSGLTI